MSDSNAIRHGRHCVFRLHVHVVTESGGVSVFRQPAEFENGYTHDREGRLISCSHRARCIMRTELDGAITMLADRFEGKRLNSPNDIVVKSDGHNLVYGPALWHSGGLRGE